MRRLSDITSPRLPPDSVHRNLGIMQTIRADQPAGQRDQSPVNGDGQKPAQSRQPKVRSDLDTWHRVFGMSQLPERSLAFYERNAKSEGSIISKACSQADPMSILL